MEHPKSRQWDIPIQSLALDSSGNPHICYFDYATGAKVCSLTVDGWDIEVLEQLKGGGMPSIAIDSNDNPSIVYTSD